MASKNQEDKMIEKVRSLIEIWAILARGYANDLGYPHCTVEQREVFGKGIGYLPEWPKEAIEVEIAVCAMSHDLRRAIKINYIYRWSDRDGSKECHCSQATFSARVRQAELFIAGWLKSKNLLTD